MFCPILGRSWRSSSPCVAQIAHDRALFHNLTFSELYDVNAHFAGRVAVPPQSSSPTLAALAAAVPRSVLSLRLVRGAARSRLPRGSAAAACFGSLCCYELACGGQAAPRACSRVVLSD
jgi:hypothetical protein